MFRFCLFLIDHIHIYRMAKTTNHSQASPKKIISKILIHKHPQNAEFSVLGTGAFIRHQQSDSRAAVLPAKDHMTFLKLSETKFNFSCNSICDWKIHF